jgi:hypothetical protein
MEVRMMNKQSACTILACIVSIVVLVSCISQGPAAGSDELPEREGEAESGNESASRKTAARTQRLSEKAVTGSADMYARFDTPGGKVLAVAADLVRKKEVIPGGCWTYVNAVYDRAGFPGDRREKIFSGDQKGPYGDHSLILPGDWIMYKNLPYKEIGHSAIFVEWIDFERRSALTIEYVGNNRKIPGRYREADITKLFGLLRGKE